MANENAFGPVEWDIGAPGKVYTNWTPPLSRPHPSLYVAIPEDLLVESRSIYPWFKIHNRRWYLHSLAHYSHNLILSKSLSPGPPLKTKKELSTVEDPFDAPTYHNREKPVTFTDGASYSLVLLAGLVIAGAAAYGVFKELIFQPKEYKIFDKALARGQE